MASLAQPSSSNPAESSWADRRPNRPALSLFFYRAGPGPTHMVWPKQVRPKPTWSLDWPNYHTNYLTMCMQNYAMATMGAGVGGDLVWLKAEGYWWHSWWCREDRHVGSGGNDDGDAAKEEGKCWPMRGKIGEKNW